VLRYDYETNVKNIYPVIFTRYHAIQFNLNCLVIKTEVRSAQTAACTVNFVAEEYQSTDFLQSSLQLSVLNNTLKHIAVYYSHN